MTERETPRVIAWARELRLTHSRLREALSVAREAAGSERVDGPSAPTAARDLLLYCRGFCVALGDHHRAEDRALFPAIERTHPQLAPVLRALEQDHSMVDYLLTALDAAVSRRAPADELAQHLDGVSAIMESHFAYEERQLLRVLDTLALDADPASLLGSL